MSISSKLLPEACFLSGSSSSGSSSPYSSSEGICSWYDFASEIIRLSGVDAAVAPCTSEEYKAKHPESADRPKWSALDNRMLRCTVGNDVRDWKDALACFFTHWDGDNGMKD